MEYSFSDPLPEINGLIGIYAISSRYDSKNYVGQSSNKRGILKRFLQHKGNLKKGTHDNIFLQRSFNKHKEENFVFRILEICDETDNLNLKEKYWVERLDSMYNKNGWNIDYIDENGKRRCDYRPRSTRSFEIMSPSGEIIRGNNMKKFAIENGLDDGALCRLINGKQKETKGWKSLHPDIQKKEIIKYQALNPDGILYTFTNKSDFCKEHDLNYSNFCAMMKGRAKSCKGWTNPEYKDKEIIKYVKSKKFIDGKTIVFGDFMLYDENYRIIKFTNLNKFAFENNLDFEYLRCVLRKKGPNSIGKFRSLRCRVFTFYDFINKKYYHETHLVRLQKLLGITANQIKQARKGLKTNTNFIYIKNYKFEEILLD